MSEREIQFYSDGLRMFGTLVIPDSTSGPVPGVVFCQGFGSSRALNNQPESARRLAEIGIASLLFDHRGLGESEGPPGRLLPWEQVQDIRDALTFLASEPGIDPERLGLVGGSFGAGNAIVAGAVDDRVRVVTALMPFGDGRRWMQSLRRYWEWDAFYRRVMADRVRRVREGQSDLVPTGEVLVRDPEGELYAEEMARKYPSRRVLIPLEVGERVIEFSPEQYVGRLAPRPLLIVHADRDTLIPVDESRRLCQAAGLSCKLVVVQGVGHYGMYKGEAFEQYMAELAAFLACYLKSAREIHEHR